MGQDKYTLTEVAQILDRSYSSVLKLVHTKKLIGNKFGGMWMIDKEELERFRREGNHPDADPEKGEEV